jgi:F-type H+-transporting ATPase subunit b
MLIDWFTVGAQIVNFLVLVWLLKRYLYRPVLAAIDAREKDLASRRDAVIADQKKAKQDQEECKREKDNLDQQRTAVLNTAHEEANKERTRLLQDAIRDAENLRSARHKELDEETVKYRGELISLTQQEIIAVVRKVLTDLASTDLERSVVDVFLLRLNELPNPENTSNSASALNGTSTVIRLRSAFALSPELQDKVRQEVQKKFQGNERIEFETIADMGLGLELIVHDQKIAWTIDGYLTSFKSHLTEIAEKKTQGVPT